MTISEKNRVLSLLNRKMRIILCDNRTFIGTLAAFDKHMNIVLTGCTEYKRYKPKGAKETIEVMKKFGLIILRGESVVSVIVEADSSRSRRDSS